MRTFISALALTSAVFLTACSAPAEDRSAAQLESDSSVASPTDESVGSGFGIDTKLCIGNFTSEAVTVRFTEFISAEGEQQNDGSRVVRLDRNQTTCAWGHTSKALGNDVEGTITLLTPRGRPLEFGAENPSIGSPTASAGCMFQQFSVGQWVKGDNGIFQIALSREADTRSKQFQLSLNDSRNPQDTSYEACKDWGITRG